MLSEGRPGIDDRYSLKDGMGLFLLFPSFDLLVSRSAMLLSLVVGVLRLELAKENYERSGLVGKALADGGRKHVKTRFGMSEGRCGITMVSLMGYRQLSRSIFGSHRCCMGRKALRG